MRNILFDLSGKIEQQTVAALSAVKGIADSHGIPFFVVGASARDLILKHCYGIEPPRMTTDIDLGVEVADWEQFHTLTDALKATGRFLPDESQRQRYHFDSVLVDIVPFGPITDENRRIAWPPEHEIFMSMAGFKEAYEYAITVRLSTTPELDIKLPTLSGLALMKIVSWREKYPERTKDAEDLLLIMHKYEDAGNFDRLYDKAQDLLEEEKFDARHASIRLLGRDMAIIADTETLSFVKTILDAETREQSQYKLVTDMIKGSGSIRYEDRFDETLQQVQKLKKGLSEITKKL
jgi:predicted nucleotidyltransferase